MGMYTDIAAEIYPPGKGTVPQGVKIYTASAAGIGLTRVDVERSGLRRPQGPRRPTGPASLPALRPADGGWSESWDHSSTFVVY